MPARIVVTPYRGGSRVTLFGVSGRELLASKVFHEPRAKGATVRSLKGLLGDNVEVEDQTVTPRPQATKTARNGDGMGAGGVAIAKPSTPRAAAARRRTKVAAAS